MYTQAMPSLEYYTEIDYYSTINDYSYEGEDYDDVLQKVSTGKLNLVLWCSEHVYVSTLHNSQAKKTGGDMEENEEADLYYSPAQREDELYSQLQRQRIKAIPKSEIE